MQPVISLLGTKTKVCMALGNDSGGFPQNLVFSVATIGITLNGNMKLPSSYSAAQQKALSVLEYGLLLQQLCLPVPVILVQLVNV